MIQHIQRYIKMNRSLINHNKLRIFEFQFNNSFGKCEESEERWTKFTYLCSVSNISGTNNPTEARIFSQFDVSIFAPVPITLKGSNPGIFQLSRKMERFETFTT